MFLLDSNILIYSAQSEFPFIQLWVESKEATVSVIFKIEILGFDKLIEAEKRYFEQLFKTFEVPSINDQIVERIIELKQTRKITLGDAIIVSTALYHNAQLVTRNIKNFDWISNLDVVNPFVKG